MSVQTSVRKSANKRGYVLQGEGEQHLWAKYAPHTKAWDELFNRNGRAHEHCHALVNWLGQMDLGEFQERRQNADLVFINQGITFSVYADRRGVEKIFPFDLMPRLVSASEWQPLEAGLAASAASRRSPNLFLYDVYHDQRILKEGIVPAEVWC